MVAQRPAQGLLLTRYCQGSLLADAPPSMAKAVGYLRHLQAQLKPIQVPHQYRLHIMVAEWLPRPAAWLQDLLAAVKDQRLEQRPLQCCHNDLNPWNVIDTGGETQQWVTLDWETAMANDPLFDVVTLYEGLCALPGYVSGTSLGEFTQAVLGDRPNEAELHHACCQFWLREYAWAQHQLDQQNSNQAIADQARDSEQRLRLLLR